MRRLLPRLDLFVNGAQHDLWHTFEVPSLKHGSVHIYCVDSNQDRLDPKMFLRTLSLDEKQKAAHYHCSEHRNRYIIARGALRSILSHYLNSSPEQICFSYNPFGKPYLEGDPLYFNLAHSGAITLVAVTSRQKVGIDVEFVDRSMTIMKAARRMMLPNEFANLQHLDPQLRETRFFNHWTRTEAYLKALGTGFSPPVERTLISVPSTGSIVQFIEGEHEGSGNWAVSDLNFDPNYSAAIAVEGIMGPWEFYRLDGRRCLAMAPTLS